MNDFNAENAPVPSDLKDKQSMKPGTAPEGGRPPIEARWRELYERLLAQRDALIDRRNSLKSEALEVNPNPLQEGLANSGTEDAQRDQSLAAVSKDQDQLVEIELAIHKIEEGTYGVCELTGRPIQMERLEAIPWARFTVEAERKIDALRATGTTDTPLPGNF